MMARFKITDLRFVNDDPGYKGDGGGYWRATVYAPDPPDGNTREVDTKYGSWQTVPRHPAESRQFVLSDCAAQLQAAANKIKRQRGWHIEQRGKAE